MFSVEQLDHLASIGIFRPSQLNDATRIDVSHEPEPFIAVDCTYAHEIDDAIRVKRLRGGAFIVQAAIADGSQLSDTPQLVEEAITKRESTYSYRHIVKSILPFGVIRELELRQPVNRALVVSQRFSKDGEQIDEPEITPSIVRIRRANLHDFAWEHFDNARRSQYDSPMVSFNKVFAHSLG
jgi:exoribonuclease R